MSGVAFTKIKPTKYVVHEWATRKQSWKLKLRKIQKHGFFACLAKFYTHKNYQVLLYSNEQVRNVIEYEGGVYHVVHSCTMYRFDVSSHIYEAAKLRMDGVKWHQNNLVASIPMLVIYLMSS